MGILDNFRKKNQVISSVQQQLEPQSKVLGEKKLVGANNLLARISIMNGKGGSGKSTLATNLAALLSSHDESVTLVDNDPQCSSIRWLGERPHNMTVIKGVTVSETARLKNIRLRSGAVGAKTSYVITDTQAGLRGLDLTDVIDRSDMMIIPVLPSAIDMRVTADFVAQIFLNRSYRNKPKPLGVVANRVINDSIIYRKLQKFLLSLKINFISTFRDNKAYLEAAEKGAGIFELNLSNLEEERQEWQLLLRWIEDKKAKLQVPSSASID